MLKKFRMSKKTQKIVLLLSVALIFTFVATAALADTMPWDNGLSKLRNNLKGRTTAVVATIAFAACMWKLLWDNQDLTPFAKTVLIGVACLSAVAGLDSFLALAGITESGATIVALL